MQFALSVLTKQSYEINHTAVLVDAPTEDAAIGLGYRLAAKIYPISEGWGGHHVAWQPADLPVDAENLNEMTIIGKLA